MAAAAKILLQIAGGVVTVIHVLQVTYPYEARVLV